MPPLVPPWVMTETARDAAASAGEIAVILVEETTVNRVAATVPKRTLVAPEKPVPVMVTVVPPLVGPEVGEIAVTAGWATAVVTPAVERDVDVVEVTVGCVTAEPGVAASFPT